jgi:hypothetical protein
MIDHLSVTGETTVEVHLAKISLKATKAFTHGSIVFNTNAQIVTFGKVDPVPIPPGLVLKEGVMLQFSLMSPDGNARKQKREGILRGDEKRPGILWISGHAQTERRFPAAEGWSNIVYKYRAYCTHPGLKTDEHIPDWLKESGARQREYWNRLAWLCREARRQCSPVAIEQIKEFVQNTILPAIDQFNDNTENPKDKMKHPAKLKIEAPGVDGLWHFVGELRTRMKKKLPVPEELLDTVVKFAEQFRPDYTPLDKFLKSLPEIIDREAKNLKLRPFEKRRIATSFKAVLDQRKTLKTSWSEGWPLIQYSDSPRAGDWGIHYYFNKAGVESSLLETSKGVPGLTFAPPINKSELQQSGSCHSRRKLREAEISLPNGQGGQWTYRFGILQHRPLPENSHIKEWKLIYEDASEWKNSRLWLCLVLEVQNPIPQPSELCAGLDIGWRRTKEGLRFGTLYEPVSKTFHELTIDFGRSPHDDKNRVPFYIKMGPTRENKRQICTIQPSWKASDPYLNGLEIRNFLQMRRDHEKDAAKLQLRLCAGEYLPPWFDKAGRRGMLQLQASIRELETKQQKLEPWQQTVLMLLDDWQKKDEAIGGMVNHYGGRLVRRLQDSQYEVANDVCRFLKSKEITRIIVENNFLAKLSQRHDNEDPESLKRSQKYRQFAAVGRFLSILKNVSVKYGMLVESHEAKNTTRMCQFCNHLNPTMDKEVYQCENCHRVIKQDQNASVNLSRFADNKELAEMALI